jgi:phage portal protein BeeE
MIDSLNDLGMRVKRLTDSGNLILATVRSDEQNIPRQSPSNATAIELDKRRAGYVDICARLNAMAVSDTPLVLYRPVATGLGNVSRRTRQYLTGKAGVVRTKQNMRIAQESDDFEIVDEHESLDIMANPNPYMRGLADLRFVCAYANEIAGNFYIAWVAGESHLYPLTPLYMRVRPDETKGRLVDSYIYGRDTSQSMEFQPDEIIHGMLFPDYSQPYYGISWLHGIIDTADLWTATESYLKKTMQAEGRPPVLINLEGMHTQEQFDNARQSLTQRLKSALRRGLNFEFVGSNEGKASAIQLGHNPKDMTSVEIGNDAERTIGNAAGVPEPIYQMSSSNVASAETAERFWYKATIMPRACREAETWTAWLRANWEGTDDWFFAPENMVPEDRAEDERTAISAWQSGLVKRDEARVVLMYDPLEGSKGDEFANAQPESGGLSPFASLFAPRQTEREEPQAQTNPQVEGEATAENLAEGEKLNGAQIEAALLILQRITEGTLARGAAIELLVALGIDRNRAVSMVDENIRDAESPSEEEVPIKSRGVHDPGDETDHDRKKPCGCGACKSDPWLASKAWGGYKRAETPDDEAGLSAEDEAVATLTGAYTAVLERMRDSIVAATEDAPMGLKSVSPRRYRTKAAVEEVLRAWGITDIDQWSEAMLDETRELIEREYFVQAGAEVERIRQSAPSELAERIPSGEPRDIIIQSDRAAIEASKFAERYARDMDEVIRTIATDLAESISDGLEKGESLREIQDRILSLYDAESASGETMSRARAERIARTEVAQASVDARIAGMAGSNIVQGYGFVKAVAACPICDAVEAETRGKVFGIGDPMFEKGSGITGTDGREYKFDYQDTIVPLHPNCRCGVEAVLVDLDS